MSSRIVVVGIGADGWAGLGERARAAILAADELVGSPRQLALLPDHVQASRRRPWPSPMDPLLDELAARTDNTTCVLASGDPMLHGIGATLARRLGAQRLDVHPHPSAFALACARLGWPQADVELVSAVARAPEVVARVLAPGRRVVVLATGRDGAARIARVTCERGYGPSRLVVLEQLGGPAERRVQTTADDWRDAPVDPLHVVAIECRAAPGTRPLQRSPGLPDDAYATTDGQLTKRHVRAMTLAAVQPLPGQLLWDVGAASGSIAIEWLRAEPSARAIAIEQRTDRAAQARANALALGVPQLDVRTAAAPAAFDGLPEPDAIFVGGGLTTAGLVQAAWAGLRPGGRIVANAVTLEGEQALVAARARFGGSLTRIEIAHAEPLGAFSAWRSQLPVVQWAAAKP
ncbi:MAG TPA: precorrin-6y C5,15-methyltransferase (decarboxylating) subunit CbiE [Solirubrobacteraceae bacterium]|jgi:precorrin-6Y C5,15-methyltransferase (decarboxylating)|nr:precorrin-6y C5,15-methyltransferase (decarboxylating) subunit CbiE [Solirubrobacteraceae bacterium]